LQSEIGASVHVADELCPEHKMLQFELCVPLQLVPDFALAG